MRTFILSLVLVSAVLRPCRAQQEATTLSEAEIREYVANLDSRNSRHRSSAIAALAHAGEPVLAELRSALPDGGVKMRRAALEVLAQIKGDEADRLIAQLAVADSRQAVRRPAIALLTERSGKAACDTVIDLACGKTAKTRKRAIELIRALHDPAYIDRLIARLPRTPPRAESTGTAGLGLEMSRSDLRGYDDYSTTYNIDGREVTQNIRMPIIGETSIKTQAVLSTGTVLRGVTGRGFGEDAARWRKWWGKNRKRYERAK